jgi:hypothetical protein
MITVPQTEPHPSPLLMPPKTDMTRSWASLSGSMGPPISGTQRGMRKWTKTGKVFAELVAVEGELWFYDDDGVESAVGVAEGLEELVGAWAALPGQGAAVADVEVFGGDLAAGGFDEGLGAGELPVSGGLGVLEVFGGAAAGEGESDHVRRPLVRAVCGGLSYLVWARRASGCSCLRARGVGGTDRPSGRGEGVGERQRRARSPRVVPRGGPRRPSGGCPDSFGAAWGMAVAEAMSAARLRRAVQPLGIGAVHQPLDDLIHQLLLDRLSDRGLVIRHVLSVPAGQGPGLGPRQPVRLRTYTIFRTRS